MKIELMNLMGKEVRVVNKKFEYKYEGRVIGYRNNFSDGLYKVIVESDVVKSDCNEMLGYWSYEEIGDEDVVTVSELDKSKVLRYEYLENVHIAREYNNLIVDVKDEYEDILEAYKTLTNKLINANRFEEAKNVLNIMEARYER